MTNDKFNEILIDRLTVIKGVLAAKAKEYSSEKDRLHNFKEGAKILNTTPEIALFGFLTKHLVSVKDIIDNIAIGKLPTTALVDEKVGDCINYFILLEALIKERLEEKPSLSS